MTNWREVDRIRKDVRSFRALAARLVTTHRADLSEWEVDFLEGNATRRNVEEFSTAQGEKLLQIRDDFELVETIRGFSVALLIKGCCEARLDLSEADEDWIVDIRGYSPKAIRRRDAAKLARLSRQLGLIEDEMAA